MAIRGRLARRPLRTTITVYCKSSSGLLFAAAWAVFGAWAPAAHAETTVEGFGLIRGVAVESRPSWLAGGFGRLDVGSDTVGGEAEEGLAKLHIALDWRPIDLFGIYIHAAGRVEPSDHAGRSAGVVEGYLDFGGTVGARNEIRGRLGLFLPPTSMENVEAAWSSPYAITHSAINSWIGEEVRLTGALLDVYRTLGAADELRFGAGVFGGNDAAGALLAWRGWSQGDRLSTYGETVPVPPLDSLATGVFRVQNVAGTTPFDQDLDDELGWIGLVRYERPDRLRLQLTRVDNRGDRALHDIGLNGGEYAWETSWTQLGVSWHATDRWSLVGEWLTGETGMGNRQTDHVQLDIDSWYALASWHTDRWRLTLRHDRFETRDLDGSNPLFAEINDEDGESWTLAAFWTPRSTWRLGVQVLDLEAARPAALQSGFDPDTDGRTFTIELRYRF